MGAGALSSRAIIGEFFNRLEAARQASWISQVGMGPFKSDQASEEYKWLGMAPAMREWIGGRQPKGFRENGVTIKNKLYESTMEVDVDELRRDKTDQIMIRVNEQVQRANDHWAKLTSTLIQNAASTVCYDGQFFFDTDHSEGDSGTQDNDITYNVVAPTAPTAAEMELAIQAALQKILGYKDDQGEPMNAEARSFLVMVPVSFWGAATAAVKNPIIVDSSGSRTNLLTNLNGFLLEIYANPRLTWTDAFAVFRTDGIVKPFILQEELPIAVDAIAEGSELEFKERKHHYGISASRNVGYGYWQHGCYVTLT